MQITPEKKTIKELLKSQKYFIIPRFQREFVWEDIQYKAFLEDMICSISFENGEIISSQYFLGTMLFIGNFSDDTKDFKVVDGQQRLTTITILLSVISRLFYETGEKKLSELLFEYIMTKDDNGEEVRILKTETSHPYFADYVQRLEDRLEEKPTSEEEDNIKEVYDYFYKILDKKKIYDLFKKCINKSAKSIKYIDLLKIIRDEVLNCLTICITTDNQQDAYKLFEILNGKGKSLSNTDLIKNKLFEVLYQEEPSDFANNYWKKMRNNLSYEHGFVETGIFLRHYWMSSRGNITKGNLYNKFAKIKQNEYKNFLEDLVKNSKYYNLTLEPKIEYFSKRKEYREAIQSLTWLNEFGVVQPKIAIIALLDIKDRGIIEQKSLTKTLTFILDFHFAYNAVMKQRPNKLNSIYSNFAVRLRSCCSKSEVHKILNDDLYKKLSDLLPEENTFEKEFVKLSYSKKENSDNMRTKFAINRLNSIYSKNNLFEGDGSVEHIIPQINGEFALNIGNLILLEQNLNTEADRFDYKYKIAVYEKSKYSWMKEFIKEHSAFEDKDIVNRSEELAKLYYKNYIEKYKEAY